MHSIADGQTAEVDQLRRLAGAASRMKLAHHHGDQGSGAIEIDFHDENSCDRGMLQRNLTVPSPFPRRLDSHSMEQLNQLGRARPVSMMGRVYVRQDAMRSPSSRATHQTWHRVPPQSPFCTGNSLTATIARESSRGMSRTGSISRQGSSMSKTRSRPVTSMQ